MKFVAEQKHLGPRAFLACVLAINTTFILAIDMYVPALPELASEFNASASYLNLTIFLFMFVSAFAVLIAGPLTDKFGRKPILVFAAVIFAVSSFGCALSSSVLVLTAFRIGQAIGFGFVMTDATALIKDAYDNEDLKLAMTLLQSLIIVGPVMAPFLGTFVLSVGDWRDIFWLLGAIGVVDLIFACLITETITAQQKITVGMTAALREMFARMRSLITSKQFSVTCVFMSLTAVPFMGFIAVCSYILFDDFGVSYLTYDFIYAGISLVSVAAPFIYLRISRVMGGRLLSFICVMVGIGSGLLLWAIGSWGPYFFILAFIPFALVEGIVRPHGFVVLLSQPPEQVGNASAFANFSYTVFGAVGTVLMTFQWPSYLMGLSILVTACSAIMLLLFIFGMRR